MNVHLIIGRWKLVSKSVRLKTNYLLQVTAVSRDPHNIKLYVVGRTMYQRENPNALSTAQPTEISSIPHIPISIDHDTDGIEHGSRIVLKQIRPHWDLDKIRYKVNILK